MDKGELDANMKRAPVIVVDGKLEIGQSKTIERFLARELGLMLGAPLPNLLIFNFLREGP